MHFTIPFFTAAVAAIFFSSCVSHTPQSRIENNPSLYTRLPAKHQEKVSRGEIERGMSKEAVYLALGDPGNRSVGESNKGKFERWDYTRLVPIYSNRFYSGFSYGRGGYGHGRRRRGYSYAGFSPQVDYIPRRSASVFFRNEKVDHWEQYRRR